MPRIGWLSWPRVCVVCGRYTRASVDCCPDCEASLPTIDQACQRCARPLSQPQRLCDRCIMALPAFDAAWAAFRWEGVIAKLLDRFKNRADLSAGRVLAALMARQWLAQERRAPDILVPIPMHWTRFWVRGFQPTHRLTQDLSRDIGGMSWRSALRLRHRVPPQSSSNPDARWVDTHNAFALRSTPHDLDGVSVALIDDVMVSGATAHAAARVLKDHGAKSVTVWLVARGGG